MARLDYDSEGSLYQIDITINGVKNFRKSQKIVTLIRLTELFAQVANKAAKSPTYSRLLLKKMFFFYESVETSYLTRTFPSGFVHD